MLILGICGGGDLPFQSQYPRGTFHDGAAVLVEDGVVVAAIEEERINRVKHSNKAPVSAIRFCLAERGVRLEDLDAVAVGSSLGSPEKRPYTLSRKNTETVWAPTTDVRSLIQLLLAATVGGVVELDRLDFVKHHQAHAASAFAMSGHPSGLVVTLDGSGEDESGLVLVGEGSTTRTLRSFPIETSLGFYYEDVTAFLGFRLFDEYKVMGLAPYGDPARYRELFSTFYSLLPDGGWAIHHDAIPTLGTLMPPRERGGPMAQEHKDVAAALQESLETIAFHLLRHYQRETGQRRLSLAGGVAHNCSLTGKVLASGLFDEVFIQPASHDAGTALGAALVAYERRRGPSRKPAAALEHVYWGTSVDGRDAEQVLSGWGRFVTFERPADVARHAAGLIADGRVVGWVQGRSEFGPRALGNRSILADPRPPENKDIVNRMVKKREAFRPFAPAVCEESVADYFEVARPLPFMVFAVKVKEHARSLLGAVSHVDGTARVQTVSRATNPRFWQILDAFRERTGVPVLLNTSFNNNVEPIVDNEEDALVCFLTTGIHHLVIGDVCMSKRDVTDDDFFSLHASLPAYVRVELVHASFGGPHGSARRLTNTFDPDVSIELSPEAFAVCLAADGRTTLADLFAGARVDETRRAACLAEIRELWARRSVTLRPSASQPG
jgi:carbamoyltransferase